MARATGSVGDIENFRGSVRSACAQTAESAENVAGNIHAWCDHIADAKQRCDAICQSLAFEIDRLQRKMDEIDNSIAALSSRLASVDPYIEETYRDSDGNEHTVTKPNPEYAALEARISALRDEKSTAEHDLNNLKAELAEAEEIGRRLESALTQLEPLQERVRSRAADVSEYAEKASKLLGNIVEILSGYLSVSLNGSSAGGTYSGGGGSSGGGSGGYGGSGSYGGSVAPSRRTPRMLTKTAQGWTETPDGLLYDSPMKTGKNLISNQGSVLHYSQDCGVVCCANVARMAGVDVSERKALETALNNKCCEKHRKTFFTRRDIDGGGTYAEGRKELLGHLGIDSYLEPQTVKNISDRVSEGRGVIISVRADKLWQNPKEKGLHAITVTSVLKNRDGSPYGFYVCDSGTGGVDCARFYTAHELAAALTPNRNMNVTKNVIR